MFVQLNRFLAGCVAGCALLLAAPSAFAQYPAKAIRIIVPLAAGGPSDLLARVVGQKMSEAWSQPVVIDNRPGANGVVGCELVARSAPDGYTLLMGTSGTHGINASLFAKLPYDTINDFAPIARLGVAPLCAGRASVAAGAGSRRSAAACACQARRDRDRVGRQRVAACIGALQEHGAASTCCSYRTKAIRSR